jgi:phage shock protein PspC (stress-responsive transcriptional regulator)
VSGLPNPLRAKPSSAGSVGAMLGKVARSFQKGQKSRRILQGVSAGIGSFLQTLRRVGKVLWLEITGFLFLWFGLVGGVACWHEYHAYTAGKVGPGRAAVAGLFAFLFIYFGVSSFWSARKN